MTALGHLRPVARVLLAAIFLTQPAGPVGSQDLDVVRLCLAVDSGASDLETLKALVETCTIALEKGDLSDDIRSELLEARGIAYRNLGEMDSSLRDLSQAVELNPESAGMRRMRAWTLREMDELTEAEAEYDRALELEPHWQGYLSRCVVRLDRKKYPEALADCKASLERDQNIDSLFFTAWLHNELGQHDRALPLLLEAREIEDPPPRIFTELIHTYRVLGDVPGAQRALRAGLARFPDNQDLRALKAELQP